MSFCFIAIYSASIELDECYLKILLIYLLSIATASFGFFLGEWTDINDDLNAKKENTVIQLEITKRYLLLIFLAVFISIIIYFLNLNLVLLSIVILQFVCFILYSVPPFRLKENKIFAVILDSIYSGSLYYFLAFSIININNYLAYLLIVWALAKGIRNIIVHLIKDKENDRIANIKTIGNTVDLQKIKRFNNLILLIETCFFVLGLIHYNLYPIIFLFILFLIYWTFRDNYKIPFLVKRKEVMHRNKDLDINYFYEFYLPISLLILISIEVDIKYLFIFPLVLFNTKFLKF
jgi:4-hydroxybenzoate polyprenyltransferase